MSADRFLLIATVGTSTVLSVLRMRRRVREHRGLLDRHRRPAARGDVSRRDAGRPTS